MSKLYKSSQGNISMWFCYSGKVKQFTTCLKWIKLHVLTFAHAKYIVLYGSQIITSVMNIISFQSVRVSLCTLQEHVHQVALTRTAGTGIYLLEQSPYHLITGHLVNRESHHRPPYWHYGGILVTSLMISLILRNVLSVNWIINGTVWNMYSVYWIVSEVD